MLETIHPGQQTRPGLPKAPTGIAGLDEVTLGGLPQGRPTLICGTAGSGKTLFALAFLYEGATRYGEPGVLMSFEESVGDLVANAASLGYDLHALAGQQLLAIDYVRIEPGETTESGEYDLEGLFVRLGYLIDQVGAKRVVLDTLEALFGGLTDTAMLRAELRRLFAWLKERGVTAIITAERGDGQLTRQGLEEYVSDCVILLDHRVHDQVTTRRLRVVKYRGSAHGTNEYPFLIDETGVSVLPITSAGLLQSAPDEAVSTGIDGLDVMLGRHGYFRASSVLVSGLAGTGKTTFAAHFADAACRRGERCLYFAFEEGPAQIARNMRSVGLDLQRHMDSGLLRLESSRPSRYGFEMHLARMNRDLSAFDPAVVVVDPLSAFRGADWEVHSVMLRLLDLLRSRGITALFTSLGEVDEGAATMDAGLSSMMDTWISLRNVASNGERNRVLYVLKSRGMSHSNQLREFRISETGISLIDAYVGPDGVLTGSARIAQEARERAGETAREEEADRRRRAVIRKRELVERQVAEMVAALEAEEAEAARLGAEDRASHAEREVGRLVMAARRGAAE